MAGLQRAMAKPKRQDPNKAWGGPWIDKARRTVRQPVPDGPMPTGADGDVRSYGPERSARPKKPRNGPAKRQKLPPARNERH